MSKQDTMASSAILTLLPDQLQ